MVGRGANFSDLCVILLYMAGLAHILKRPAVLAFLTAVLALAVRLPGLGDFMTVDEAKWMVRSGQFYHKLFLQGDPSGTFITTHPGASVMWLAGAGIVWQESRLGFDIDTSNLKHFRLAAALPVAAASALLIGLNVGLLARLLDWRAAGLAGVVLATDPYLTGMSQIVHPDALLALFMTGSFLAFIVYWQEVRRRWLMLTGVLAGLAAATKLLPSLWLLAVFAIMVAASLWLRRSWGVQSYEKLRFRDVLFAAAIAVAVLALAWPALMTRSDLQTGAVIDTARNIMSQEHVAPEVSKEPIRPASFYLRTVAGRGTPFTLILSAGMLVAAVRSWRRNREMPLVMWFFIYAAGYLVLITLAAKKADRYALPALVMLPLMAGWGLGVAMTVMQRRGGLAAQVVAGERDLWTKMAAVWGRKPRLAVITAAIILLLLAQVLLWSPYAIAYSNPSLPGIRPASQQGWGEGLDAAARLLNTHPVGEELYIASWYPSVTGTYFKGKTMSLSSRNDKRVAYVLTYRNMAGRAQDDVASNVLDEWRESRPVYTVAIGGRPYVNIYALTRLHYFPRHAGELTGGIEVGQVIPVARDNWSALDVGLATFSGRSNTGDVVLHVREDVNAREDLRTVAVNASEIKDSDWHRFEFEPIKNSSSRTYYVSLTSPQSVEGDAVTVKLTDYDLLPGEMVLRRRPLKAGEKNSDFLRSGDLAYRLP